MDSTIWIYNCFYFNSNSKISCIHNLKTTSLCFNNLELIYSTKIYFTKKWNKICENNLSMIHCYSAVRLTGPFVTMVYSMIAGDMLTFGIIYTIVLFGFSQSFYFLYKGFPGVKSTLYHSYHSTWMALFQITLGDYSVSLPHPHTRTHSNNSQLNVKLTDPYNSF